MAKASSSDGSHTRTATNAMSDEKTMIHDDINQNVTAIPEAQGTGGADARVPTKEGLEINDNATTGKTTSKNVLTDQTNLLPTRQVITVFIALSIALMCSFLDQTIVATALPKIASNLRSGKESAWVATAYLLTSLAFTPLYGRWSDVFGRKQVLIVALGIFWIFSLACAVAQTMLQLIIFRALQGVGGGALITMCLIIISDIVSLEDRGKYMGITEAVIAISNGVGPILGGVFSEYTSWRWAFWINLPLGGIAIAVSLWFLPLKPVEGNAMEKLKHIDYLGSFLTVGGSVLLLLGLNWGGITYSWTSAPVLVTLVLGIVIFIVFLVWEGKGAQLPIVPPRIFRHKTIVGVYIATCMNGMTYFTVLYYVPQFLQLVRGTSPVTSSLLALPFLCPVALFVFASGQIAGRTGHYRYVIIAGYTLWCVAQGLQSTIVPQSSDARIAVYLLLGGIGAGCTFQTSLLAAQAVVPRSDMAVVTGVRNFVRLLGSTFALAISGALVNNSLRSAIAPLHLSEAIKDTLLNDPTIINSPTFRATLTAHQHDAILSGYQRGFKSVFYLTIACVCAAWLASVLLIGQHDLKRADDAQLKEESKRRLEEKKNKRKMADAENTAGMNTAATSAVPSRRQSSEEKNVR